MASGELSCVVADTAADPVAAALPVTAQAGLGAYVGVPLRSSSGELLGSLCCLSSQAEPALAERDVAFMHVLARLMADRLERHRREAARREELERLVAERSTALADTVASLRAARAETAERLSMAVEYRDDRTGAHIVRVGRLAVRLAEAAGMDEDFCADLAIAAPLHDVGKVAAPDAVLLKPGRLEPHERALIEAHPEVGFQLLADSSSSVLRMAARTAWTHHERMDGHGYPRGLRGDEIPVEGRIVAIVDVFDALTSDRHYRPAYSVEEAVRIMREDAGHFDEELLRIFVEHVATDA
jgi:putative two-component system response regulator